MIFLYILAVILGIILIILLVPVSMDLRIDGDEVKLKAGLGPVRVTVLDSSRPEKKKAAKDSKQAEKEKPRKDKKNRMLAGLLGDLSVKDLTFGDIKELFDLIADSLSDAERRILRRIRIPKLILHISFATGDPFSTAVGFGAAGGAIYYASALLDSYLTVGKKEIMVVPDFISEKIRCRAEILVGFRLINAVILAISAIFKWIPIIKKHLGKNTETDKKTEEKAV